MMGILFSKAICPLQKRSWRGWGLLSSSPGKLGQLLLVTLFFILSKPSDCNSQEDRRAAAHQLSPQKAIDDGKMPMQNYSEDLLYSWFDNIIGIAQLGIHEGEVYQENHRVKSKRSKFFPSADFSSGTVQFNGQIYFNLNLKYNVYDDELLLLVENALGGNILKLNKSGVENFAIQGHRFKYLDDMFKDSEIPPGFYEITMEGPFFSLLIKHRKLATQQLESNLVFYEFEDLDKLCILQYRNKYELLNDISDLTKLFPKHKEALAQYYKDQKRKSSFDTSLYVTLRYLETLIAEDGTKSGQP